MDESVTCINNRDNFAEFPDFGSVIDIEIFNECKNHKINRQENY